MKRIICIALVLISSLGVFAQNNSADTSAKYAFMDYQSDLPDHLLIVLNDKIYEGNLADLKVKVRHIEIYKGPGACAIYGVKGAKGVMMLSSEKELSPFFSKPATDTSFDGNVVYISDGELSDKNRVDEKDVLSRSTLKGKILKGIYERKLDSIVTIISRTYAIEQYQKKLSAFSADYKKQVEFDMKYNHNDNGIFYMIIKKGGPGFGNDDNMIRELYNLPVNQISNVELHRQQTCCGTNLWLYISLKPDSLNK